MKISREFNGCHFDFILTDDEMYMIYDYVRQRDLRNVFDAFLSSKYPILLDNDDREKMFCDFLSIYKHYDSTDDNDVFNYILEKWIIINSQKVEV